MDIGKVPGYLFKQSGKFKYEVFLDYWGILNEDGSTPDGKYINPNDAALKALKQATQRGTSGVSLETPGSYHLVVIDPPQGFPVMVVSNEQPS